MKTIMFPELRGSSSQEDPISTKIQEDCRMTMAIVSHRSPLVLEAKRPKVRAWLQHRSPVMPRMSSRGLGCLQSLGCCLRLGVQSGLCGSKNLAWLFCTHRTWSLGEHTQQTLV